MNYFNLDLKRNLRKTKNQAIAFGLVGLLCFLTIFGLYSSGTSDAITRLSISESFLQTILTGFISIAPLFAMYFFFLLTEEERKDKIYARVVECGVSRKEILIAKLVETFIFSALVLFFALALVSLIIWAYSGGSDVFNKTFQLFFTYFGYGLLVDWLAIEIAIFFSSVTNSEKGSVFGSFIIYLMIGKFFAILYRIFHFDFLLTLDKISPFTVNQGLTYGFRDSAELLFQSQIVSFEGLSSMTTSLVVTAIFAIVLTLVNQYLMKNKALK